MNWDDLRIIAAVADQGTYARAGARLRLDETTVGRRIARVQARLGISLFELVDGVRRPTAHCDEIVTHIRQVARHVTEIGIIGRAAPGVVGTFRVASTSSVIEEILAPHAAGLLNEHPGLTLRFMASDENLNFSRWEADLAIRLKKPAKGDFAILRLGGTGFYLFEPAIPPASCDEVVVCRYSDDLESSPESKALKARGIYESARCVTDSLPVMRSLLRNGSAAGILPGHVCGDLLASPLVQVTALEERQDFWLLVQNHLKRDRPARVVIDWIRRAFGSLGD